MSRLTERGSLRQMTQLPLIVRDACRLSFGAQVLVSCRMGVSVDSAGGVCPTQPVRKSSFS